MPNAGPTVAAVQRIEAYTESSFASDESSNLASFTPLPIQEGTASVTLTREMHDPMQLVQNQLDYREEVVGRKSCQIQFTMPLAPTGVAAGQGTPAVQGGLGLLLSTVMGGEDLGQGTTVSTGWGTAGGGNVSTATGIEKGAALGWVNANGKLEARPVANKSGSAITLKRRFSTAPATSNDLYASASYYMTQDPDSSLSFAVRGYEDDHAWLLSGCQLESMSLNLPLDGSIPTIQFTFQGVDWSHETDTAAGSFASISAATYSNFDPIVGHAGDFLESDVTALTGSTVHVSAVGFEPQIAYQAITSPSGTNGVYRWRLSRSAPVVQGSFTTFYEDDSWFTARDDRDDKLFLYQVGTTQGQTLLIEASTCQVTDAQMGEADSGILGVTVSWKGRLDAGVSSPSSDLQRSPFRIHFL